LTSVGLGVGQLVGATSPAAEATAILIGIAAAALVKFVLLQAWVFRSYTRSAALSGADTITAIAA
jgi:putative flippase GtrA